MPGAVATAPADAVGAGGRWSARCCAAWTAAALRPVDIASLAAFRIIFGAVMCLGILRLLTTGWIETMYVEPRWFFHYPGFSWVAPWPAWGMYLHYAVLAALALAIALGAFHRAATLVFVVGFAYTQLIDVTNYLNHHYLVVLLGAQLALLPASAAWSIDARRGRVPRRRTVPAWMVWLLRFQVGLVYVFAGLAKAKLDWLGYGQPLNLWLAARTETPVIGALFIRPWVALAMAWAGFAFDSTIVLWLSWRRTRLVAYALVIAFHGLTGALFNIGMFPLIMTSSALIFFSPSWPRRLLGRFGGPNAAPAPSSNADPATPEAALAAPDAVRATPSPEAALAAPNAVRTAPSNADPATPSPEAALAAPNAVRTAPSPNADPATPSPEAALAAPNAVRTAPSSNAVLAASSSGASDAAPGTRSSMTTPPRWVRALLAIHIAVQIALPLRHLAYPGDVLWNEDGMRFAWHVLIREKHGKVSFLAEFADGKRLEVPPHDYLTARQDREMSGQPDLILQLAHAIGRDLAARGYRGFEIHAITSVSLNGRAPIAMIDPAVDLLAIRDLGPRRWVLPGPEEPPPRVRPAR